MKYISLTHLDLDVGVNDKSLIENIGNYIQVYAIDELYKYMGLKSHQIVKMSSENLINYSGEKLILPINFMLADIQLCPFIRDGKFIFSEDIIPVFLSISIKKGFWHFETAENIAYLKKHEPIGCRDFYTYQELQKYGIKSYLAGCLTMTLPKREKNNEMYKKVFFVEPPQSVTSYIPKELFDECEFIYHEHSFSFAEYHDEHFLKSYSKEILKKYRDNARLIVTSRLHCALPCLAMGIPVILVKEYLSYPFDLVVKFLPVYTPEIFDQINWNPENIELENHKKITLECAAGRLKGVYQELHEQYETLYKMGYQEYEMSIEALKKKLSEQYLPDSCFSYALWGISSVADKIYDYITYNYPNARLVKVIDTFRKISYHGLISEKPEILKRQDDFVVIVTTINCVSAAVPFFNKIKKSKREYFCVANEVLDKIPVC